MGLGALPLFLHKQLSYFPVGRDKFKASNGWLGNFKRRHDIRTSWIV
jgi:hypothetical protein